MFSYRILLIDNVRMETDTMLITGDERTVESEFHRPMLEALEVCDGRRDCPGLSDEDFLKSGVGRCITDVRSGHDWIQYAGQIMGLNLTVGRFFDSLKSLRRLNLLSRVCDIVCSKADAEAPVQHDPFSDHNE